MGEDLRKSQPGLCASGTCDVKWSRKRGHLLDCGLVYSLLDICGLWLSHSPISPFGVVSTPIGLRTSATIRLLLAGPQTGWRATDRQAGVRKNQTQTLAKRLDRSARETPTKVAHSKGEIRSIDIITEIVTVTPQWVFP
ncbi:hypothetical protein DPEC_G00315070 [Dallia pectoralis]|uniref:Uncharacterized protein n=1 Tax=Dallia pectoralis TaxID=75939 RepID=A0ACC2FC92_DALPE|nr:hypothetical protein DPEC_G00315070 [Dallia pectoralis]